MVVGYKGLARETHTSLWEILLPTKRSLCHLLLMLCIRKIHPEFIHSSLVLHEADGEVVEDRGLVEVREAREVVLPDEDVRVAQRWQRRQPGLEGDRDLGV